MPRQRGGVLHKPPKAELINLLYLTDFAEVMHLGLYFGLGLASLLGLSTAGVSELGVVGGTGELSMGAGAGIVCS